MKVIRMVRLEALTVLLDFDSYLSNYLWRQWMLPNYDNDVHLSSRIQVHFDEVYTTCTHLPIRWTPVYRIYIKIIWRHIDICIRELWQYFALIYQGCCLVTDTQSCTQCVHHVYHITYITWNSIQVYTSVPYVVYGMDRNVQVRCMY